MPAAAKFTTIGDAAVIGYIFQGLEEAASASWVPQVANQFQSNQASETYAGVGNVPNLREWVGEKLIKNLREHSITISNKDWESTIEISKKDLDRDKTGQLLMRTGDLARRAAMHDEKLISDLLLAAEAGTLGTAYDGQFFFDTDHSVGDSGTINNDIESNISTTTAPTATEASTAIMAAIQALYGFKDDRGEPANQNVQSFMIQIPTVFWSAFQQAISKDYLSNGVSNPLIGNGLNLRLVPNPRLTWTEKFAVLAMDQPRKPFISQIEDGPRVEVLGEGSDYAFHNAAHLYSVVKRGNVGFGDFTKAILTTFT